MLINRHLSPLWDALIYFIILQLNTNLIITNYIVGKV